MIELTSQELEALGLPPETEVTENTYSQYANRINGILLTFAGATGYALNSDGSIQWTTPEGITIEQAEATYLAYPKFRGRPYSNEKDLNNVISKLIQDEFVSHFASNGGNYVDVFSKVMTLKLEGDTSLDWEGWMTKRNAILDEKAAYVQLLQEQGKWA